MVELVSRVCPIYRRSGQSQAGGITICGGPSRRDCYHSIIKSIVLCHTRAMKPRFRSSDMHRYLITAM